jgi:pyruvate dehydrogenase E2 component (dihydrolipoamide acetyltransferase)
MAISVVMPALEMAQETGKIVSWRKKEGEGVKKGETLLEVETDKAVVEIEANAEGILGGVTAKEGDVIPVGQTIAWLLKPGEEAPKATAPTQTARTSTIPGANQPAAAAAPAAPPPPKSSRVSPKARRLAAEHDIDLSTVVGTGIEGAIEAADVQKLVEAKKAGGAAPAPAARTSAPAAASATAGSTATGSIWKIMAERTTQSWTTVPHFFVIREVDASAIVAVREKLVVANEKAGGVKPTISDVLVSLVAQALKKHSRMNGSWTGDSIRNNPEVNIGLAAAVADGVVTLVIRNADSASVADIAARRRELTERAKANKLQPADISGATFTISNLGMYQVDAFTAIIVPPQAGILAIGAITNRVVPVDGNAIGVRPMMSMSLSCDHRVVDGARGAEFLKEVADAIAQPDKLIR